MKAQQRPRDIQFTCLLCFLLLAPAPLIRKVADVLLNVTPSSRLLRNPFPLLRAQRELPYVKLGTEGSDIHFVIRVV